MNAPHDYLFWSISKKIWAARSGEAKLARLWKGDFFYNLEKDPGEKNDLAPTRKDDAVKLAAALETWDKELVPPAFPGLGAGKKSRTKPNPKK
jgi:hypothetical protein